MPGEISQRLKQLPIRDDARYLVLPTELTARFHPGFEGARFDGEELRWLEPEPARAMGAVIIVAPG
jgi:hypothetical protein